MSLDLVYVYTTSRCAAIRYHKHIRSDQQEGRDHPIEFVGFVRAKKAGVIQIIRSRRTEGKLLLNN